MSRHVAAFVLSCCVCASIAACGNMPQSPSAPSSSPGAQSAALSETMLEEDEGDTGEGIRFDPNGAAQAVIGGRASGHAQIQATPVQNVREESYSFTAAPHGEPPFARGQVQVHVVRFTGEELRVHSEVTCTSVAGNQAWVGARVTRLAINNEEVIVDLSMIFRVQDNGDNAAAVDLASLVFFGEPGLDLTHCNTRQQFPVLRPTTAGNIQVKE